jgi:hypothetical protein
MVWPDLLLLEMFEAVQKDLAIALEVLQHRQASGCDASNPLVLDHMRKIGELQSVMAALESALERPESRIIH